MEANVIVIEAHDDDKKEAQEKVTLLLTQAANNRKKVKFFHDGTDESEAFTELFDTGGFGHIISDSDLKRTSVKTTKQLLREFNPDVAIIVVQNTKSYSELIAVYPQTLEVKN